MIYLRRDNKRRSEQKRLVIVVAILGILILLSVFSIEPPSSTKSVAYFLGRPVWALQRFVYREGKNAYAILHTKAALVRENQELREQVKELEWSILDFKRVRDDLLKYENMLGRSAAPEFVLGKVLAKPGTLPYDTFILDVGEEQGIIVGDTVVIGSDIAVGKILDVRASVSKAQFFSSVGVTTPVLVGERALAFDAHGYGGGDIVITVPRDLEITEGEPVFLPTDPRTFIGEIEVVNERPSDAMKLIGIRLPVNVFEISYVKILHAQPIPEGLFTSEPSQTE